MVGERRGNTRLPLSAESLYSPGISFAAPILLQRSNCCYLFWDESPCLMERAINRSATSILPQRSNCCYLFWDEFSHPPEPAANRSATSIPVLLLKSNFCYLFWDRLSHSHPPPPYFFWDQIVVTFFSDELSIIPPAGASNLPLCHLHTYAEIKLLLLVLG